MAKKKSLYGTSTAPRDKPKKRPGRHKKNKRRVDKNPYKSYIVGMKEKKLTITSKDISQKQWSNLILELNLITKAWAPYATISLHAPGIKKVIAHGTRTNFKED